mmetsp:Transcript_2562/g.3560  ORF Transcript_2562/g.3560 Transcript_2562/m.3560 type:complete len:172 (-) Transcript_2562:15-530(-)
MIKTCAMLLAAAAVVTATDNLPCAAGTCSWSNKQPDGPWVPSKVALTTDSGVAGYPAGANVTVTVSGAVREWFPAGHIKSQLWEYTVSNPTLIQDNSYFQCHGYPEVCDPCKPLSLTYSPSCAKDAATSFTFKTGYTLPAEQATGNYTLSLISGHYYPKELVIEVYFQGTK